MNSSLTSVSTALKTMSLIVAVHVECEFKYVASNPFTPLLPPGHEIVRHG